MKNFRKKFLLVLLALMPCFQTIVMAGFPDGEPEEIPVSPKPVPNPNGPRSRSRARYIEVSPECYYYNGEVSIYADSSITSISASVTRLDDNMQWTETSISNTLTMVVSTDPGTYLLTLTLSDGKTYIGEYTLY